jgi:hypothetical protein
LVRAKVAKGADEALPEKVAVQIATNFKPVVLEAPDKACNAQRATQLPVTAAA